MNYRNINKISIIIPCKNEGIYIKQTLDFILRTEAKYMADIIIVDDNSNDNCCDFLLNAPDKYPNTALIQTNGIGPARARNLGADLKRTSDIFVFCDAHIVMEEGWLNALISAFGNEKVSAVCPGIGHFDSEKPTGYGQSLNKSFEIYWLKKPKSITEIPIGPSGCIAVRKNVFCSVNGFDNGFCGWGYEDVEFSLKLWLFGYRVFVHPGVRIGHKFRTIQPYDLDLTEVYYNKLRMALNHFNMKKVSKILNSMINLSNYEEILERIIFSDTFRQRSIYLQKRIHDDNWFFNKFNIPV